jgi:hypothetical protein
VMFWEAAFEFDLTSNTTYHKPPHKPKACNKAKRHIFINPVRKSIISSHASKLLHRFSSTLALSCLLWTALDSMPNSFSSSNG